MGAIAFVTGVSGTVGSSVAARLDREGFRVRGLVRGDRASPVGCDTMRGDLVDRGVLYAAARGAELCVHTAAERSSNRATCRRSNVEGVTNLVDALVSSGCKRLVHISTISVYDDSGGPVFDEDSILRGESGDAYGDSKAESERIIAAAAARGLLAIILRPGLVASMHPRSRWGPLAIQRAAATSESILPFPELPYVHVDNLAEAVVLAAQAPGDRGRA